MEGRISREEILSERASHSAERGDPSSSSGSFSRPPANYRSPSRSVRKRPSSRYDRREEPDDRGFFVVQLLASGILLLLVMFTAIIDSESTNAIASGLNDAFSRSATFNELKEGFFAAGDKLKGGADIVLEIFGSEIDKNAENSSNAGNTIETDGISSEVPDLPEQSYTLENGAADVDAEMLKEIYEYSEDYLKN